MSVAVAVAPPNDLDAEGAVLSAVMLDPAALARVRGVGLAIGHFYSDPNARIFDAVLELADRGEPVDPVTVAGVLRDRDRLQQVGGMPYLSQLTDATPAVLHVEAHARKVIETAARRQVRAVGHRAVAESTSADDVGALAADMTRALAAAVSDTGRRLERLGAGDVMAPLSPVPWLVQALDLCPGAPALIAGYGYSGKTAAVQVMAVELAAGLPVWGTFRARRGRVLHLDYEQGRRLTLERYQRIARAHMLGPEDLAGLEIVALPDLYLDTPGAEDVLARECDGVDLLVIDSLRAAAPTVEENSSEVRRVLDLLARVSERTGTTCIVIHHARKPSLDKSGGARMAIRGSGAIFDACSSVLCFEGERGQPTRVSHEKARTSGITAEDFELVIADVEIDGNPRGGLAVTAQGAAPAGERVTSAARSRVVADASTVAGVLAAHPGIGVRDLRAHVRARSGAGVERVDAALAYLGAAVQRGTGARGARPMSLDVEQLPEDVEVPDA